MRRSQAWLAALLAGACAMPDAPAPPPTAPTAQVAAPLPEPAASSSVLAIVIDDVGRDPVALEWLATLPQPLSFALLPHAPHTPQAARRLRAAEREVLVHLPMEPLRGPAMREGLEAREHFLTLDDAPEELTRKIDEALDRVPDAIGVNNHMGSRLTAEPAAMQVVMERLAARGLFFLDSRTSAATHAEAIARRRGLLTASRHVFLDHEPSIVAIEGQLEIAAQWSAREPVIAIAHPSYELYAVLRHRLPELERRGIEVLPLTSILRLRALESRGGAALAALGSRAAP